MFDGDWGWLGSVAGYRAMPNGPDGAVDDDCSYVVAWGSDPTTIAAPTLLVHGSADRIIPCSHGRWLAAHLPNATLDLRPGLSHISILSAAEPALEWIREQTG
jgi:pimeloyl-ACP methyl ester carboxylesterase